MQDGLYKVTDAGKEALSTVKEFNDLETDLAMATGESRSYASDLTQSYNALGQELGSITSDVAKSADSWLRQGQYGAIQRCTDGFGECVRGIDCNSERFPDECGSGRAY